MIQPDEVKTTMKAMVAEPETFMKMYACSAKAWEEIKKDPPPERMTLQNWAEDQKADH